jgi:hypothetical protein
MPKTTEEQITDDAVERQGVPLSEDSDDLEDDEDVDEEEDEEYNDEADE